MNNLINEKKEYVVLSEIELQKELNKLNDIENRRITREVETEVLNKFKDAFVFIKENREKTAFLSVFGDSGVGKSAISDMVQNKAEKEFGITCVRINFDNNTFVNTKDGKLPIYNAIIDALAKNDAKCFIEYNFLRSIYEKKFAIDKGNKEIDYLINETFDNFIAELAGYSEKFNIPFITTIIATVKLGINGKIKRDLKKTYDLNKNKQKTDFIQTMKNEFNNSIRNYIKDKGILFLILDNAEDIYKKLKLDVDSLNSIMNEFESSIWLYSGTEDIDNKINQTEKLKVFLNQKIEGFNENQITEFAKKYNVYIDGYELNKNLSTKIYKQINGNISWLRDTLLYAKTEQNRKKRYLTEVEFVDILNIPHETCCERMFDKDFVNFSDYSNIDKTYALFSFIPSARKEDYDYIVENCSKFEYQFGNILPWYIVLDGNKWKVEKIHSFALRSLIKKNLENNIFLNDCISELKIATKRLFLEKRDETTIKILGDFYSTFCSYDEIKVLFEELDLNKEDDLLDFSKAMIYYRLNQSCLENCSDIRFLTEQNKISVRDYRVVIDFCKRAINSFNEFNNDEMINEKLWPIYIELAKTMKFNIRLNTEANIKYCHDTFKYFNDKTYEIIKEFEKLDKSYCINKCLFEISYSYSRFLENKTKTAKAVKVIIDDEIIQEYLENIDYYIEKYEDNEIIYDKLCNNKSRFFSEFYSLFDDIDRIIEENAICALTNAESKFGKDSLKYVKSLNNNHRIYKGLGFELNCLDYFEKSGEYIYEALLICIDTLSKKEKLSNHDKKIINQIFDNISHYFSDVSISTKTNEMISNIENIIFSSYDFLINSFYNVSDLVTTIIDYYVDNHMYFQLFSFVNKLFDEYCEGNDYRILAKITKNNYSYFSDLLYETQLKNELNDAIRLSSIDDQEKSEKNKIKVNEFKRFITLGMKFFTESHFENEFMFKECRFIFFDLVENFEMIDSKEYKNKYIEDVSSCDIIRKYWYRLNQNNPKYLQWRDFERDAYQYMCYKYISTYSMKKKSIEKESAQKLRKTNFNQLKNLINENLSKESNPKTEIFSEILMYSRKIIYYDIFTALYMSYIDIVTDNSFKKNVILDVKDLAQLFTSSISWKNYNYDLKLIGVDSDARFGLDNKEFDFRVLDAPKLVNYFVKKLSNRYRDTGVVFISSTFTKNVVEKLINNFEYYIRVFNGSFNPFLLRYRATILELEIELPYSIFKPESHFAYFDTKCKNSEINEDEIDKQFWIKFFGISSDVNTSNESRIEIMKYLEKALVVFTNEEIKSAIYWNMFKVYSLLEGFDHNKAIAYGEDSIRTLIQSGNINEKLISNRLYGIVELYEISDKAIEFINEIKSKIKEYDGESIQKIILKIENIKDGL